MKNLKILFGICLLFLTISSCTKDDAEVEKEPLKSCPSVQDNISWTNGGSCGAWYLGKEGNDGYSAPTSDGRSCNLKSACGWQINGTENGGGGNTYALFIPGIIFRWKHNVLCEFVFTEQWKGTTLEGIKMGDVIATFLAKYPDFQQDQVAQYIYTKDGTATSPKVNVFFTDNDVNTGKLTKIIIGYPGYPDIKKLCYYFRCLRKFFYM